MNDWKIYATQKPTIDTLIEFILEPVYDVCQGIGKVQINETTHKHQLCHYQEYPNLNGTICVSSASYIVKWRYIAQD